MENCLTSIWIAWNSDSGEQPTNRQLSAWSKQGLSMVGLANKYGDYFDEKKKEVEGWVLAIEEGFERKDGTRSKSHSPIHLEQETKYTFQLNFPSGSKQHWLD
jgi:hypothetical protein